MILAFLWHWRRARAGWRQGYRTWFAMMVSYYLRDLSRGGATKLKMHARLLTENNGTEIYALTFRRKRWWE